MLTQAAARLPAAGRPAPPPCLPLPAAQPQRRRRRAAACAAQQQQQQQPPAQQQEQHKQHASLLRRAAAGSVAALASAALLLGPGPAALAADTAKVGSCLLQNCQAALAQCLADGECVANLVCLQLCNGAADETACQIKCGDRFSDPAIESFTSCVVSEKKCVPQRVDKGVYPVPPDCALDAAFDLSSFQGRWYITAGLNPLFDTFPCQEHYFAQPQPGTVYAEINWRIPTEDPLSGEPDFLQRSTMQRFVQTVASPAILENHDNEYLHYQDDWYILASKPDEYVFIYYKGQNDAWVGYGGATVYTREKALPPEYIPELQAAAEAAGLDWSQFVLTDNTCPPKPPKRSLARRLELGAARLERTAEQEAALVAQAAEMNLQDGLRSFGRGFTVLEQDLSKTLREDEVKTVSVLQEEAQAAGRMIRRMQMEAKMGPWIRLIPESWRPVLMPIK